jgi:hypothetical protein
MVQWDWNASEHNQGFCVIHRVNKEYYDISSYLNWNPDTMCTKGCWKDQNHNDNTTPITKYKSIACCLFSAFCHGTLRCPWSICKYFVKFNMTLWIPYVVVEWLIVLLRIREVPCLNLGPKTGYTGMFFVVFLSPCRQMPGWYLKIRQRPLPSKSFRIHYSRITPSFDDV